MRYFDPTRPVRVGTYEVSLILDEVAEQSAYANDDASELQPAQDNLPPIWVRDSDIEASREKHPNAKVFGFWQVLLFNNACDPSKPLNVCLTAEGAGYYCHFEDGKPVETALFSGGLIPSIAGSLETAHRIDLQALPLASWKIPPFEALTAIERAARSKRGQARQLLRMGAAAAVVVTVCAIANFMLSKVGQARMQQIAMHAQNAAEIQAQVAELSSRKDAGQWPHADTIAVLQRMEQLVYASNRVDLPATDVKVESMLYASVTRMAHRPTFASTITYRPDGRHLVGVPHLPSVP